MHIKFIIVEGFKSYKNKTVFGPFDTGNNVVIGRNGSGKSNFLAAVDLVLSKNMWYISKDQRQLMIHQGTGRCSLRAEVKIIFDNSDRRFPCNMDEVTISREMSSKKDQFVVNGQAYQKEMLATFLEYAGLVKSNNPYNMVKQGRIHTLAVCSDEERLKIVQELTGFKGFSEKEKKIRKAISTAKSDLDSMVGHRQSLESLSQKIREEKGLYEEYMEKKKTKDEIEQALNQKSIQKTVAELAELAEQRQTLEEDLSKMNKNCKAMMQSKTKAETDLEVLNMKVSHNSAELADIVVGLETTCAELEQARLERDDLVEIREQISQGALSKLAAQIKETEETREELNKKILEKNKDAEELHSKIERLTTKADWIRCTEVRKQQHSSEKQRNKWIDSNIAKYQKEEKALAAQVQELESDFEKFKAEADKRMANASKDKEDLERINSLLRDLRQKRAKAKEERESVFAKYQSVHQDFRKLQSEKEEATSLASRELDEMMANKKLRGKLIGLKSVLQLMEEPEQEALRGSYFGLLADLIQFPPFLTMAIDQTAMSRLYYHVVDSKITATEILARLNRRKFRGEFKFLPLEDLLVRSPTVFKLPHDVLSLTKQLRFPESVTKAIQFVFGRTLVCKSRDDAKRLAESGMECITLDGDKYCRGVVTGGYINEDELTLRKYLRYQEAKAQQNEISKKCDEAEALFKEICQDLQTCDQTILEVENSISRNKKVHDDLQSDLSLLENVQQGEEQQIKSLQAAFEKRKGELVQTRELLEMHKNERRNPSTSKSRQAEQVAEIEKELVALRQSCRAETDTIIQLENKLAECNNRLTTMRPKLQELCQSSSQQNDLKNEVGILDAKIGRLDNYLSVLTKSKELAENIGKELGSKLSNAKKSFKKSDDEVERAEKERSRHLVNLEHLTTKEKVLAEKKRTKESALKFVPGAEDYVKQSFGALKSKLKAIMSNIADFEENHDINLQSISQHEKLETSIICFDENYNIKIKDQEEIENAHRLLQENSLAQTFYTFQEVNKYFCDLFKQVIPEGSARMLVRDDGEDENGSDLENAKGLAIEASFNRGGKTRSMKHLSGGQKSVIALLFIISLQKCDPAPIYVFDEVDAAIDESYLKSLGDILFLDKSAQYITVTFRPQLLYEANKFFGIYYRQGNSKVKQIEQTEALDFITNSSEPDESEDQSN